MIATKEFELIYTTHYDAVLRYCLRRSSMQDALDAAGETFAVAWRRRDALPSDRPLPWLYGTAKRVLSNQRRSTARQSKTVRRMRPEHGFEPGPEAQAVHHAEVAEILDALDRLGPDDREIIRLAGWEELPRDGIAEVLGCSPNAATKRLHRALNHLAAELGTEPRAGFHFFHRERSSA